MKLQMPLFIIVQKLYKLESALDPYAIPNFLDILLWKKKKKPKNLAFLLQKEI